MNAEKTGEFIAKIRGELGLTQRELADRIGVTDKAVSKWETGRGVPDVGILEILAGELGVSVTELMNGEKLDPSDPEKIASQTDSAIIETLRYIKQMSRKTIGIILIIIGAVLAVSPLYTTFAALPVMILGLLIISGGIFMLSVKGKDRSFKIPKIAFEFISLAALAAAIILELLPNGVVLWWARPDGDPKPDYYSYFNPLPFGMANFSPLITAGLTVIVTILTIIAIILGSKHTKFRNALFICLIVTAVISMCSVLYGFKYVTPIGACITIALGISAVTRAAATAK